MAGQGSTGNVIAALASFFIPGLGQLLQGRIVVAAIHFVLASVIGFFTFGIFYGIMSLWSAFSAAVFKPK